MTIPEPKRDGKLISRLLAVTIVGFDKVMDRESQLYLRLLARLVDKAFYEYCIVRELLLEEMKIGNRLAYRIEIVNNLENCVSAISGISKILYRLANGSTRTGKRPMKKNLDIYNLISDEMKQKVSTTTIWAIRNMIEHIDKEIYLGNFQDQLFLDINEKYETISINGKILSLAELADMITVYHELVLQIFNRLPKKMEKGKYYYGDQ